MQRVKLPDAEEVAERVQAGEDISSYFTRQYIAKQNVTLDLPLTLLRLIDAECQRLGISRAAWIQEACAKHLSKIPVNKEAPP